MLLSFRLSMPGAASWNGRWSGEDRLYVKVRSVGRSKAAIENAERILEKGYYSYGWDDGWRAGVSVTKVTAGEAAKLRRKSAGFCGYDWMIDSILRLGYITSPSDEKRAAKKAAEAERKVQHD